MSREGAARRSVMRSVAFLTTAALAVPALAACSSGEDAGPGPADQDLGAAARGKLTDGRTAHWAVDALPKTLNVYQSDADDTSARVAGAVLPTMFRLDAEGRPVRDGDFLESAKLVDREPQTVLYKLNQQAVWSDGREIGAADFVSQWRALSGRDSSFWTARNAGYNRIEKIERGDNDLEVRVTFDKPYADWQALFSPLYPKQVMGDPDAFNEKARTRLPVTAGPFRPEALDEDAGDEESGDEGAERELRLVRNDRWWGDRAKLDALVLRAVPEEDRLEALRDGEVDVAALRPEDARSIRGGASAGSTQAAGGPPAAPMSRLTAAEALRSWAVANGSDEEAAGREQGVRERRSKAQAAWAEKRGELDSYEIRKSLGPTWMQLALNGAEGPLADERVRRAVARAVDRAALAHSVLDPLGLPDEPVGSHLALAGQHGYADGSDALGEADSAEARALLADAGWVPGGPLREGGDDRDHADAREEPGKAGKPEKADKEADREEGGAGSEDSGDDGKAAQDKPQLPGGAPGAYAPKGTAAPGGPRSALLAKDGKALTLRFVLPEGPGSEQVRRVAASISKMLARIGIRTQTVKVDEDGFFGDHIAAGKYDLALYSWPATAFPATDSRPLYAKPVAAADGSIDARQNWTGVGSDYIDQLFDQASAELDQDKAAALMKKADARIWAQAGSLPLFQRPQLVAVRKGLANVGAFGFEAPDYEDIGFVKGSGNGGPSAGRPEHEKGHGTGSGDGEDSSGSTDGDAAEGED